jgi:hypothetical protein
MRQLRWWSVIVLAFALLAGVSGGAQGSTPANPEIEERAMGILERVAQVLAQAQRYSVTVDIGYDVVQDSGQKIELGETRTIVVRRPDHIRIDTVARDGSRRGFIFDGKELAVFDIEDKVYATLAKTGTIDDAIDYFVNDLGMRLPLSDLFSSKLPETMRQVVQTARYVGQEPIAGELCDHVAVREVWTDWQVWVTKGDQPQFRRVVITYRCSEGQPQFWARFRDWNFSPDVPDALFVFQPAEGAVKIPFARRQNAEVGEQERKGEQR